MERLKILVVEIDPFARPGMLDALAFDVETLKPAGRIFRIDRPSLEREEGLSVHNSQRSSSLVRSAAGTGAVRAHSLIS